MRPDPSVPCDLRALEYGEHLIVWSFRAILADRWDCDLILREYRHACGDRAEEARGAVRAFVDRIEQQSRRPLTIGRPGSLGMTRDEQQLLAAYSAAQRGDEARFEAHLTWLLARPVDGGFYGFVRTTAEALADRGHHLSDPGRAPPAIEPPPQSVTA